MIFTMAEVWFVTTLKEKKMRRFLVISCAVLTASAWLLSLAQAETANNKTTKDTGKHRQRGVISNPNKGVPKRVSPEEIRTLSPQPLPPRPQPREGGGAAAH